MLDRMETRAAFLDPNGRSGRRWFLVAFLGLIALEAAERLSSHPSVRTGFNVAGGLYVLWFLLLALPRRAHDVGHPAVAFWLLYLLIGLPLMLVYLLWGQGAVPAWMNGALAWGLIVILLLIWPGKPEANQWGPVPIDARARQLA